MACKSYLGQHVIEQGPVRRCRSEVFGKAPGTRQCALARVVFCYELGDLLVAHFVEYMVLLPRAAQALFLEARNRISPGFHGL